MCLPREHDGMEELWRRFCSHRSCSWFSVLETRLTSQQERVKNNLKWTCWRYGASEGRGDWRAAELLLVYLNFGWCSIQNNVAVVLEKMWLETGRRLWVWKMTGKGVETSATVYSMPIYIVNFMSERLGDASTYRWILTAFVNVVKKCIPQGCFSTFSYCSLRRILD